jgi:P-type Cu2+ transporter
MKTLSDIKEVTVPVTGMSCAACAVSVESMLKHTPGVTTAAVNYATQSVNVGYDPHATDLDKLDAVLQSIGYGLIVEEDEDEAIIQQDQIRQNHYLALKQRTLWAGILSLPVFIIAMFFMDMPYGNFIMMGLTLPLLIFCGRDFFVNAWKQASNGKANMDTLVALSTGIAFLFSAFNTLWPQFWHARGVHPHVYFESAAVIIFFILLGKLIEERAKSNTSDALRKLMDLRPKTVRVIREGAEQEISAKEVITGDLVLIRPGEKIPVDGEITEGISFVDESLMTGEAVPVNKKTGDQVLAGTINQHGSITFVAQKVGRQTALAQIIKNVQQAQGSKAPVQKLVDKIAGIFVPVVIVIAIVTFAVWMFFGGESALTHALLASVSVLVIACPCALGLATPTAIMVGIGKGAQHNILIRDAESLEMAHSVDHIVLDKTGTLTEGHPEVTEWHWAPGVQDKELHRSAIRALESRSEHPLARALVSYLKDADEMVTSDFKSIVGSGISGTVQGVSYKIGTVQWIEEEGGHFGKELTEKAESLPGTISVVSVDNKVIALISIADRLKSTSAQAIKVLQSMGIVVHMLTGDNIRTAETVARETGIDSFLAGVKPDEKRKFVADLQAQGKTVAMVGDGINDSEALAQADVSIAMGKGSDIAMDVSKMTLITSDLMALPKALQLSRKTVRTIRQNLFWAFIYNLIGIPVAAGVLYPFNEFLLSPMLAGAAMAMSSVSVVLNSLRLKAIRL